METGVYLLRGPGDVPNIRARFSQGRFYPETAPGRFSANPILCGCTGNAALRATNARLMEEICDLKERIRELEGEGA